MVLCIDCDDTPEFTNFFDFAEHIMSHDRKEMMYPELIKWAENVINSEDYINWRLNEN